MKPTTNRFATLLRPGVRGQVVSHDAQHDTIYSCGEESIVVITGQLLPGVWAAGYKITRQGGRLQKKLPGEGAGWFSSQDNALLYALGAIRCTYDIDSPQTAAIDKKIATITQKSIF